MKAELIKVNSYYEGMIQNLYAGSKGCFVAFMQFFYQFNQSVLFEEKFSSCFQQLYENELKNCQTLCNMILKMGGDCKFYSSSRKFLSGYNVDYIKNFQKIFLADIEFLEINIIEVRNMIEKIEDEFLKIELRKVLSNKKQSLKILKEEYFKFGMF